MQDKVISSSFKGDTVRTSGLESGLCTQADVNSNSGFTYSQPSYFW